MNDMRVCQTWIHIFLCCRHYSCHYQELTEYFCSTWNNSLWYRLFPTEGKLFFIHNERKCFFPNAAQFERRGGFCCVFIIHIWHSWFAYIEEKPEVLMGSIVTLVYYIYYLSSQRHSEGKAVLTWLWISLIEHCGLEEKLFVSTSHFAKAFVYPNCCAILHQTEDWKSEVFVCPLIFLPETSSHMYSTCKSYCLKYLKKLIM